MTERSETAAANGAPVMSPSVESPLEPGTRRPSRERRAGLRPVPPAGGVPVPAGVVPVTAGAVRVPAGRTVSR